jgi:DNA mismatch endonuclease Vsr
MTDHLDKAKRSWNMSRIRGKDTKPEIAVRKMLHAAGFRFRLHVKELPGKPDIILLSASSPKISDTLTALKRIATHWIAN